MCNWLDSQTKAILEPIPPKKPAGIALGEYCLAVIRMAADYDFNQRVFERIDAERSVSEVGSLLERHSGVIVKNELSYEGALMGQFELICADTHSVFSRFRPHR
ncbi:MAG: hypothetical protein AAGD22_02695 [Verrucomicrobiota bacterium]